MKTRTIVRLSKAALVGAVLMVAACRRHSVRPSMAQESEMEPDQTLSTFTMDSYTGAALQWTLVSPHANLFDRDHRVDLDFPEVQFFSAGRAGANVTAAEGRLDTESKDFWAGGGVVMVSTDGIHLESDWVRYEKMSDRFVSTAPVTVTRGRSIVQGVGWEARSDLSDMVIRNQRGEIAPEDNTLIKKK